MDKQYINLLLLLLPLVYQLAFLSSHTMINAQSNGRHEPSSLFNCSFTASTEPSVSLIITWLPWFCLLFNSSLIFFIGRGPEQGRPTEILVNDLMS